MKKFIRQIYLFIYFETGRNDRTLPHCDVVHHSALKDFLYFSLYFWCAQLSGPACCYCVSKGMPGQEAALTVTAVNNFPSHTKYYLLRSTDHETRCFVPEGQKKSIIETMLSQLIIYKKFYLILDKTNLIYMAYARFSVL